MVKGSRKYRFVLWLSASDKETFDEHLTHCAYSLKPEIQRSDGEIVGSGSSSRNPRYLPMTLDVPLHVAFTDWVRSEHDESSKVLVVLDDLDGLELEYHKDLSRVFATDAIDLIYTSRNPFLAYKGSSWPAKILRVPALFPEEALTLLDSMLSDQAQTPNDGPAADFLAKNETYSALEILRRLDHVPAAIIVALQFAQQRYGILAPLQTLLKRYVLSHSSMGPRQRHKPF